MTDGLDCCKQVAESSPPSNEVDGAVEKIDDLVHRGKYLDRAFLMLAHGGKLRPAGEAYGLNVDLLGEMVIATLDDSGKIIDSVPKFARREPDDWEAIALKLIRLFRRVDPTAFKSWVPYRKL